MQDDRKHGALWTRRDVIARVSAMLGGATLVGQAAMLAGCEAGEASATSAQADSIFDATDVELFGYIAETILPETETPGAREAGVGAFITVMVQDTYSPAEQETFLSGMESLQADCKREFGKAFGDLAPEQRLLIAERLDKEQYEAARDNGPAHYFRMLKELTVLGFFSSEVAYQHVLEYAETPGRYDPCRPLNANVRMMAGHAASLSSN
jgi:hypothetical protein